MSDKPKVRFQRANYLVRDLERSLTLYRDILGFETVFMKDSDEESYSYDVFEIDRSHAMRFCVLRTSDQPNVMGLTEVADLPPITDKPSRSAIVLEIPEFDRVLSEAAALGLKTFEEEKLITKDGREGREAALLDFDGNLVVIYIILKAAA